MNWIDEGSLKRVIIGVAILIVIFLEAHWVLSPRNYISPHSPESIQAVQAYQASPSDESEAKMMQGIRRDINHNKRPDEILFGLMLLADFAGLILLLRNCHRNVEHIQHAQYDAMKLIERRHITDRA